MTIFRPLAIKSLDAMQRKLLVFKKLALAEHVK